MGVAAAPWHTAPIVAFDLEGSGAQDRAREAILELAAVPLVNGRPEPDQGFSTLVNPGRPIPRRPWISPGLTDDRLAGAPSIIDVGATLAGRINGRWLLGHNVNVDWRLLRRHLPHLRPAGLIDTLPLARQAVRDGRRSLTDLINHFGLAGAVDLAAPGSQPHRALWDATAVGYLLGSLAAAIWPGAIPTLDAIRSPEEQPRLF
ncbi:3'-5' exonuclease [Asanoa ferruginea]|uniref:3'-5' exonuclease n=1 Tax=Asanoa ferruginea TaxID=53367 RepID=UPI000E243694|nr:3'-5' exonuclease [Asanoa ferruginea]